MSDNAFFKFSEINPFETAAVRRVAAVFWASLFGVFFVGCRKVEVSANAQSSAVAHADHVSSVAKRSDKEPAHMEEVFQCIPQGAFQMGGTVQSDSPVHEVNLDEFRISETEVLFREWKEVRDWALGAGYEFENRGNAESGDEPVVHVNWYDAVKWCNAKSEKAGAKPCYYLAGAHEAANLYKKGQVDLSAEMVDWDGGGFRLPTEAEWEKAARGGLVNQQFPSGNMLT
jgi:formylglycine-generating enzyme required for sulfatase activity